MQLCEDDLSTVMLDQLVGNYFLSQPNYDQLSTAETLHANDKTRNNNIRVEEINSEIFRQHGNTLTRRLSLPATLYTIPDNLLTPLTKLTDSLDMSEGRLQCIGVNNFKGLNSLRVLVLSNNQISKFSPGAFSGLENVRTMNLDNNKLTEIKSNVFVGLPKLNSISLNSNQISTIAMDAFDDVKAGFGIGWVLCTHSHPIPCGVR